VVVGRVGQHLVHRRLQRRGWGGRARGRRGRGERGRVGVVGASGCGGGSNGGGGGGGGGGGARVVVGRVGHLVHRRLRRRGRGSRARGGYEVGERVGVVGVPYELHDDDVYVGRVHVGYHVCECGGVRRCAREVRPRRGVRLSYNTGNFSHRSDRLRSRSPGTCHDISTVGAASGPSARGER